MPSNCHRLVSNYGQTDVLGSWPHGKELRAYRDPKLDRISRIYSGFTENMAFGVQVSHLSRKCNHFKATGAGTSFLRRVLVAEWIGSLN